MFELTLSKQERDTLRYKFYLTKLAHRGRTGRFIKWYRKTASISGHHRTTTIKTFFKVLNYTRFIKYRNKKSGHNITGKLTVHTKSFFKKSKYISAIRNLNVLKYYIFLLWYCRKPKKKITYILTALSNGQLCYIPMTNYCMLLRLTFGARFSYYLRRTDVFIKIYGGISNTLLLLPKMARICYIARGVNKPITIAKAPGCSCKVIKKRTLREYSKYILKMPSGKLCLIGWNVTALCGYILPKKTYFTKNTKAGYWRNLGHKPQVRGVVKNPVDHPSGGRCRTVWKPRSPWGKYAK